MNEIVYNILRKFVECPEKVEYNKSDGYYSFIYHYISISGTQVLKITTNKRANTSFVEDMDLTTGDCLRILRGIEHVQAMKIRNL